MTEDEQLDALRTEVREAHILLDQAADLLRAIFVEGQSDMEPAIEEWFSDADRDLL